MEKREGIKGRCPNVNKTGSELKGGMLTLRCTKAKHIEIIDRAAKLKKSLNQYLLGLVNADLASEENF
jgi:predicted HicB family RNase H-like nuclease